MTCPFCGEEMVLGRIRPMGLRAPFWLPDDYQAHSMGPFLTTKGVESIGGRVIGKAAKIGFIAYSLPASLLCRKCDFLITKL